MKSRRIAGLVLAGLAPLGTITACGGPPAAAPPPRPSHVQVVAHPDDDILFMNPDLAAGIRRGDPTASIFLTGGESDLPDRARYISQRQDGTRAAFARMAGAADQWQRTVVAAGNHHVEVDRLASRPQVALAFLNLPEDNDPAVPGGKHSLVRLHEQHAALGTVPAEAGAVRIPETYGQTDVDTTLEALYERFRPTTIGLQDPQPDPRYRNEWAGFHNHPDHVVGAQLAHDAADQYQQRTGAHADVVHYRDYNVADSPVNLAPADRAAKHDEFSAYTRHDRDADTGGAYADWIARSRYRWPRGTQWAGRDGRGVVHAFAVRGYQIAHWQGDGSRWSPPRWAPTPGRLRPTVRLVDQRGRLALVAQSFDGRHVLVQHQRPDGSWPQRWRDLGAPGAATGVPAAAADARGRLVVVARNETGGVSALREDRPGVFGPWRGLGGGDVQGSPSVVLGADGRLDVFAATSSDVVRWRETAPGQLPAAPQRFLDVVPAGPPAVERAPDGAVRLLITANGGATVDAYSSAPGGHVSAPRSLPNPGGMSQPALKGGVAFVRDGSGTVRAAGPGGSWADLGGPVRDAPAVVAGPGGRRTLLAVAPNGQLVHDEQQPGPGLFFQGWRSTEQRGVSAEAAEPR